MIYICTYFFFLTLNLYQHVLKSTLISALLLLFIAANAQSLSPISKMVAQAKSGQGLSSFSFFEKETRALDATSEFSTVLPKGTLLQWDEAKFKSLQDASGQAIALTIPWENGATLPLELVVAKNFSDEFVVHTATTGDTPQEVERGMHYWGIVKNHPNSLVCISIFENEMVGMVNYEGGRFTIAALPNNASKDHILYKDTDLAMAQPFHCETDDDLHRIGEEAVISDRSAGPDNCVKMFIECDFTLFQNKGSVANVVTYMTGVMSQVSALYTNESVNLVLNDLFVWNVVDPYTGPSASNYLTQFRTAKNGVYNGSLAHLVGIHNLGGVAYLDVLCNALYGVGYSSINATFSNVPIYSWTVEVLAHEIGHNLGSSHTHACVWNGNNTAIDGCGPTAGYSEGCTAALPTNGGTVMSYCHLVSGIGINFANGFGPQPGNRIRSEVYNASCLAACGGGGGGCTYAAINSQNFDAGWGIWTDGGTDCARINNATFANSPTFSIQLRDNTNTSVTTTTSQNWTTYDEITVDFSYISVSFETGEDFWVQLSTNGGSTYTTYGDFNAGTQFSNNVRSAGQVIIPGPFTSTTRLRFRADASADDDVVYIDDVVITGCLQQFTPGQPIDRNKGNDISLEKLAAAGITALKTGPNPNSGVLMVQFDAEEACNINVVLTDLTGRVVVQNNWNALQGFNNLMVPTQTLSNGMYILSIQTGDSMYTEKIIMAK